jgi:cobalt-zinc-cadmium efflux system protein
VARTTRLAVVLLLNLALVAGLVVAGIGAHSVGVLAAGGDYLADAAAIGVSLLAIGLASRYPRATAYAALINVTVLLAVVAVVAAGAAGRLVTGAGHVHGLPVLVVSGAAALVMLAGGLILRGDDDAPGDTAGDRANMRAVLLDTLADSAAAAGVAITGAIILADPGLSWLDPAIALVIAAVVGYHALRLAREVITALQDGAPPAPPGMPSASA